MTASERTCSAKRLVLRTNCLALAIFALILILASIQHSDSASLGAPGKIGAQQFHRSARDRGCYYMLQHYKNGQQIKTDEPCLNCTCENSMLMCYLRVCPYVKPVGDRCIIERIAGECCPRITCPSAEQPIEQQPEMETTTTQATTTTTTPTTTTSALDSVVPAFGAAIESNSSTNNNSTPSGCLLDNKFYPEGAQMPSSEPSKTCEVCYCIRNRAACVMQDCALEVSGCAPVYTAGSCCPTRYNCSADNAFTTPRPRPMTSIRRKFWQLGPGQFSETSPNFSGPAVLPEFGRKHLPDTNNGRPKAPAPGCRVSNSSRAVLADGERVPSRNKCEHCYCMRGEIVCAVQECRPPCDGCVALPNEPDQDQCCPTRYECDAPSQRVPPNNVIYPAAQQEFNVSSTAVDDGPAGASSTETSTSEQGHERAPNRDDKTSSEQHGGTAVPALESTTLMMSDAPPTVAGSQESPDGSNSSDASSPDKPQTSANNEATPSDTAKSAPGDEQNELSVMTTRQTRPPLRPISPKLSTASDFESGNFETSGPSETMSPSNNSDASAASDVGQQGATGGGGGGGGGQSAAPTSAGSNVDGFNLNGGEREQDQSDASNNNRSPVSRVEAPEGHQTAGPAPNNALPDGAQPLEQTAALSSTPRPASGVDSPTSSNEQDTTTAEQQQLKKAGRPLVVQSHVPGEGSCRYNGKLYQNGEEVKSKHNCTELCMCINSVVYCDEVDCPRAPDNVERCQKVANEADCCPKYICPPDSTTLAPSSTTTTPNAQTGTELPSSQTVSSTESSSYLPPISTEPTGDSTSGGEISSTANEILQPANERHESGASVAPTGPAESSSSLAPATGETRTNPNEQASMTTISPQTAAAESTSEKVVEPDLTAASSSTLSPQMPTEHYATSTAQVATDPAERPASKHDNVASVESLGTTPTTSMSEIQPESATTNSSSVPNSDNVQSNTIAAGEPTSSPVTTETASVGSAETAAGSSRSSLADLDTTMASTSEPMGEQQASSVVPESATTEQQQPSTSMPSTSIGEVAQQPSEPAATQNSSEAENKLTQEANQQSTSTTTTTTSIRPVVVADHQTENQQSSVADQTTTSTLVQTSTEQTAAPTTVSPTLASSDNSDQLLKQNGATNTIELVGDRSTGQQPEYTVSNAQEQSNNASATVVPSPSPADGADAVSTSATSSSNVQTTSAGSETTPATTEQVPAIMDTVAGNVAPPTSEQAKAPENQATGADSSTNVIDNKAAPTTMPPETNSESAKDQQAVNAVSTVTASSDQPLSSTSVATPAPDNLPAMQTETMSGPAKDLQAVNLVDTVTASSDQPLSPSTSTEQTGTPSVAPEDQKMSSETSPPPTTTTAAPTTVGGEQESASLATTSVSSSEQPAKSDTDSRAASSVAEQANPTTSEPPTTMVTKSVDAQQEPAASREPETNLAASTTVMPSTEATKSSDQQAGTSVGNEQNLPTTVNVLSAQQPERNLTSDNFARPNEISNGGEAVTVAQEASTSASTVETSTSPQPFSSVAPSEPVTESPGMAVESAASPEQNQVDQSNMQPNDTTTNSGSQQAETATIRAETTTTAAPMTDPSKSEQAGETAASGSVDNGQSSPPPTTTTAMTPIPVETSSQASSTAEVTNQTTSQDISSSAPGGAASSDAPSEPSLVNSTNPAQQPAELATSPAVDTNAVPDTTSQSSSSGQETSTGQPEEMSSKSVELVTTNGPIQEHPTTVNPTMATDTGARSPEETMIVTNGPSGGASALEQDQSSTSVQPTNTNEETGATSGASVKPEVQQTSTTTLSPIADSSTASTSTIEASTTQESVDQTSEPNQVAGFDANKMFSPMDQKDGTLLVTNPSFDTLPAAATMAPATNPEQASPTVVDIEKAPNKPESTDSNDQSQMSSSTTQANSAPVTNETNTIDLVQPDGKVAISGEESAKPIDEANSTATATITTGAPIDQTSTTEAITSTAGSTESSPLPVESAGSTENLAGSSERPSIQITPGSSDEQPPAATAPSPASIQSPASSEISSAPVSESNSTAIGTSTGTTSTNPTENIESTTVFTPSTSSNELSATETAATSQAPKVEDSNNVIDTSARSNEGQPIVSDAVSRTNESVPGEQVKPEKTAEQAATTVSLDQSSTTTDSNQQGFSSASTPIEPENSSNNKPLEDVATVPQDKAHDEAKVAQANDQATTTTEQSTTSQSPSSPASEPTQTTAASVATEEIALASTEAPAIGSSEAPQTSTPAQAESIAVDSTPNSSPASVQEETSTAGSLTASMSTETAAEEKLSKDLEQQTTTTSTAPLSSTSVATSAPDNLPAMQTETMSGPAKDLQAVNLVDTVTASSDQPLSPSTSTEQTGTPSVAPEDQKMSSETSPPPTTTTAAPTTVGGEQESASLATTSVSSSEQPAKSDTDSRAASSVAEQANPTTSEQPTTTNNVTSVQQELASSTVLPSSDSVKPTDGSRATNEIVPTEQASSQAPVDSTRTANEPSSTTTLPPSEPKLVSVADTEKPIDSSQDRESGTTLDGGVQTTPATTLPVASQSSGTIQSGEPQTESPASSTTLPADTAQTGSIGTEITAAPNEQRASLSPVDQQQSSAQPAEPTTAETPSSSNSTETREPLSVAVEPGSQNTAVGTDVPSATSVEREDTPKSQVAPDFVASELPAMPQSLQDITETPQTTTAASRTETTVSPVDTVQAERQTSNSSEPVSSQATAESNATTVAAATPTTTTTNAPTTSSSSSSLESVSGSVTTSSPAENFVTQTLNSIDFKPVNLTTTIPSIRGSATPITIPWQDVSSSSTASSSSGGVGEPELTTVSPVPAWTPSAGISESKHESNGSSTRLYPYDATASTAGSSEPSVSVTTGGSADYEDAGEEPGCEYEGKSYSSAQQIPRSHPCDFCFCFRGDIICLQQTCPPPVPHCFETVIDGFCCPRYECPVHTVRAAHNSSSLTLTPYETHSRLHTHNHELGRAPSTSNNKASNVRGCYVDNKLYGVGKIIESASGPCLECRCDRSGMMQCNPKECAPEDPLLQQINREVLQSTLSRSQMR